MIKTTMAMVIRHDTARELLVALQATLKHVIERLEKAEGEIVVGSVPALGGTTADAGKHIGDWSIAFFEEE